MCKTFESIQLLTVELRKDVLRIAAKISLGKQLRAIRELSKFVKMQVI